MKEVGKEFGVSKASVGSWEKEFPRVGYNNNNKYTEEEKAKFLRAYENEKNERTLADIARDFGIPATTVYAWIKNLDNSQNKEERSLQEVEVLKEKIEKLEEENKILKQAVKVFLK